MIPSEGYIHSIETFGSVDGPGIRLVVFMQGCPMRCLYCHNPDTWDTTTGKKISPEEIVNLYERNIEFYQPDGGITFSGGEPLLQLDFLIQTCRLLKKHQIHICIDTSGITYHSSLKKKYQELLQYVDLFLLDIKQIDPNKHFKLTGHKNENILEFARFLNQNHVPMWIRYVVVPSLTDQTEDLIRLGEFIGQLDSVKRLEVLPYHDMGKVKYEKMGLAYPLSSIPAAKKEEAYQAKLQILQGIQKQRG